MNNKHTPGPWKYALAFENNAPNYYAVTKRMFGAPLIARCFDEANAAFIVRACNAHSDLLAALKAIEDCALKSPQALLSVIHNVGRAAIAKATG